MGELSPSDLAKTNAAMAALDLVENGMRLGLGTGSTAKIFVDLLGAKVADGLKVAGVPTSERTAQQCRDLGIPLVELDDVPKLDMGIDGADEFDPKMNLIKGGGGALLREKIVASACARFIVIADVNKEVDLLGAYDLPVEVIKMALVPVKARLADLGASVTHRQTNNGTPYLTDEGNYILDCAFGATIADPVSLGQEISQYAGVVEHGLFCGMSEQVIVGLETGVRIVK